jgi:tetratricopeptide (TPR) repeat protein
MDGTTLELLQRGIVRLEAGALCFKTEVHRAYVYYAVAPELRQVFHAKLGRALVSGAPTHGLRTLEAAEHLMKAGLAAEAAQALVAGAAAAARRGTLTEVEAAVRNVLGMGTHLGQGDQLRVVLAEAVSARGAHTECLQVLETIQPTSALSPRQRALCLVLRAQALQRTRVAGDAELRSATLKALDAARESGDSSVLATSIHVAVEAASELGDQVLIAELVSSSEALARDSVAPSTRGRALLTTAFCLMNSGSFEVARGAFSRAEELLREASLDAEVARAINGQALCLIAIGEHASALKRLIVGHRVAQGINDVHNESALMSNLGVVYEEVGMFSEARWCYRNAAAQERPLGVPRRLAMVFVNAASIELIHGDLTGAARDLSEARDAALKTGLWRLEVLVDLAEADFHLACGEPELAWPLVQRWMRHVPGSERGIDTNGRALRLLLQCFRATEGAERFHARLGQLRLDEKPLKLAERLEVRGYIYHALRNEGADTLGIGPVAIAETGLLGVLAALACVGIHLDGAPACYPQESAAAYVERTFPRDQRTVVLETPERLLTSR